MSLSEWYYAGHPPTQSCNPETWIHSNTVVRTQCRIVTACLCRLLHSHDNYNILHIVWNAIQLKTSGGCEELLFQAHIVFNKCIKTEFRQREVSPLRHWTVFFGLREAGTSLNRTVTKMSLVPHYMIFLVWCKRLSRDCLVCKITDMYCIVTGLMLEAWLHFMLRIWLFHRC